MLRQNGTDGRGSLSSLAQCRHRAETRIRGGFDALAEDGEFAICGWFGRHRASHADAIYSFWVRCTARTPATRRIPRTIRLR